MSRVAADSGWFVDPVPRPGPTRVARRFMQAQAEGGFTMLELAVVVAIISILAVLAIDKIWALRKDAERAAVVQVVGSLRSALGLEVASRAVRNRLHTLPELEGRNPMELMAQAPPGYLGELEDTDPAALAGGQWYFDADYGALVYLVRFRGSFQTTLQAPPRLRFRVVLRYEDVDDSGRFDAGSDRVHGLDLIPIEPYS